MSTDKALLTQPVDDVFAEGSVTVEGLKAEFGIGRTVAYELMSSGRLPWTQVHEGGRSLIPRKAIRELLKSGLIGGGKEKVTN